MAIDTVETDITTTQSLDEVTKLHLFIASPCCSYLHLRLDILTNVLSSLAIGLNTDRSMGDPDLNLRIKTILKA